MKSARLVVLAALAALATAAAAQGNPFSQFKGKMKPGLYDYKVEMDMSHVQGIPPQMAKQTMTMQHCITPEQIEQGGWDNPKDRQKMACEPKNVKVSGNTATYTMECKDPPMTMDNTIVFGGDGFKMDMRMTMQQGGQVMKMNQKAEAKYLGACK